MTTTAPTACRDYQALQRQAGRAEDAAATTNHTQARIILALLAGHARGILANFDAQPELHTHIDRLGYGRAVALYTEMMRIAHGLVAQVVRYETSGSEPPHRALVELRADLDALVRRADELGAAAVQHPPRLGLDTMDGSRALSRTLIRVYRLREAADAIDLAIGDAARLPHPDPAVDALAATAAGLRRQIRELEDGRGEDWWHDYLARMRDRDQAAART